VSVAGKVAPTNICLSRVPRPQNENDVAFWAGQHPSRANTSLASPEEGAALIRAFVRITQPEVRAAILELTVRLAPELARDPG
jgi:hypothetical protein